ncbi:MAG: carboxymuconolactone decarboxylase family protein, partial [Gammaproteobacteria bacterium]|nr:carboxymuconolactone decarboxylase family protein [Gammaproteobacteria bacterium]
PSLMFIAQKIDNASNKTSFDPEFRLLAQTFASMTNGCQFCHDYRLTLVIKEQIGTEKFMALENYKTSSLFSKKEQAALAYIEEATENKRVTEETFSKLRRYFTDTEIVELTWINAAENYYNSLMIPLGIESDELRQIALQHKH